MSNINQPSHNLTPPLLPLIAISPYLRHSHYGKKQLIDDIRITFCLPGNFVARTSTELRFISSWSTWCWLKYPIFRFRWACLIPLTGFNSPSKIFNNVVFPAPFSPTLSKEVKCLINIVCVLCSELMNIFLKNYMYLLCKLWTPYLHWR